MKCQNIGVHDSGVRYARNGDVHLAYRVLGDGEVPLVVVPGWVSNVDLYDDPSYPFAPLIEKLAGQTRLVLWDKRGTGLSDPVTRVPTLDERMDDLHAVLDAGGVDRPALLGISEGGPMSILFAATFPDRVLSLVLYGTAARFTQELPDFPWGLTQDQLRRNLTIYENHWGEGLFVEAVLDGRRRLHRARRAGRPCVRRGWVLGSPGPIGRCRAYPTAPGGSGLPASR